MEVMVDLLRPESQRDVQLALHSVRSARREHADHRVLQTVQANFLPEDIALATEAVLPYFMGENDLKLFADLTFGGQKIAPEEQRLSKDFQKTRGTRLGLHLFRLARRSQAHLPACPRSHRFKGGAAALPIQIVPGGNSVTVALYLRPHHDNAIRLSIGQRRQQSGIYHAEDRGVRADSQGKGKDRNRGEAGVFPEKPQPV